MDKDNQTLLIRRCLDVPAIGLSPNAPYGRYIRMQPDEIRIEYLTLTLPVWSCQVFQGGAPPKDVKYASRLSIEIGYYKGDLPAMIFSMLEEEEKKPHKESVGYPKYPTNIKEWFGGLRYFLQIHEYIRDRNEEVNIPWTNQSFKGEKTSRFELDDLRIPYEVKFGFPILSPPDLSSCTRIEIQYHPSMLEYFFPYIFEQNLLSPAEKEYLKSQKDVVSDNLSLIKSLADEVVKKSPFHRVVVPARIITEQSIANIICYNEDKLLTSFTVYDDRAILTEGNEQIKYKKGLPSLRGLTLQIIPFELRIECATNLKNLWYRFNFYKIASKSVRIGLFKRREVRPYPAPDKWCDYILRAYKSFGYSEEIALKPFICRSAGEGKCHYAMNPNCELNSPGEMVLLFETKAGWNRHGGPELFTLDNHDPRGGCVLLNDGTVKFIRIKEELQKLRWK